MDKKVSDMIPEFVENTNGKPVGVVFKLNTLTEKNERKICYNRTEIVYTPSLGKVQICMYDADICDNHACVIKDS
ncbi:MAG: hypothetical protein ACJ71C_03030 [Nitrososphaeraceae archaeon]